MVNIQDLFDDAKCYQTIREMRWPDGVGCSHCSSDSIIKNGRDDTEPHRQPYECKGCRQRFDDLTDTIFAGHHLPLRTWIACLYLMGLNLSGLQIAQELDINKDDARAMISQLRQGIVDRRSPPAGGAGGRRSTIDDPLAELADYGPGVVLIRFPEFCCIGVPAASRVGQDEAPP